MLRFALVLLGPGIFFVLPALCSAYLVITKLPGGSYVAKEHGRKKGADARRFKASDGRMPWRAGHLRDRAESGLCGKLPVDPFLHGRKAEDPGEEL